ncbi:MAG: nitroreductase/quinone reductase family protein [Segniliparus sp.]|uniref:nitroreductase/quinone reductase family protein n=1 Tax=Segniliparus sp. TaxID=2804064 RepID=UPI003F2F8AD3
MSATGLRYKAITLAQRHLANPLMRRNAAQTLLETKGRVSGEPRRTPLGGRVEGASFWFVSEMGYASQYVKNIQADPRVRVRVRGAWRQGTAVLLPEDDAKARLARLPKANSSVVQLLGMSLLTVRVDFDE